MEESKKYTLRFRKGNKATWQAIKVGRKWVETRAASVKYRHIKAGDRLVLVCDKRQFEKEVKRVQIVKSVKELLAIYKLTDIMPDFTSDQQLYEAYDSYAGYREKIKKHGIIASVNIFSLVLDIRKGF